METVGDAYFDRDIGQYLKRCRQAAGWSQAQVADLLGVTFQQVQKYENGTNRLPAGRYAKLAQAINFFPAELLLGGEQPTPAHPETGLLELVSIFRRLNAQQRHALMEYAQTLRAE